MIGAAYFLIAIGCLDGGLGWWQSLCWPVEVGKLIARASKEGL